MLQKNPAADGIQGKLADICRSFADHGIHYTPYSMEKSHPDGFGMEFDQPHLTSFPRVFPSWIRGGATLQNWDLRTGCAVMKGAEQSRRGY